MVKLGPRANVVQEHVVDLWSEVFLGYRVVLQQTKTSGQSQDIDRTETQFFIIYSL